MADLQEAKRESGDHVACQAAHQALYEAAVEAMENPGLMKPRDYFEYRLGTMGHLYHREGITDLIRERDEARSEAQALAEAIEKTAAKGSSSHLGRTLAAYRERHPKERETGAHVCRECWGLGGAEVRGGPGACERCGREATP